MLTEDTFLTSILFSLPLIWIVYRIGLDLLDVDASPVAVPSQHDEPPLDKAA